MKEIKISLHPKQLEALRILQRPEISVLFYGGARGGGKSHLARNYIVGRALSYPGSKSLIIRSTYPDLERSVIANIKKEYGDCYINYSEKKHMFEFANGSTIECTYIQHEKDLENIQGAEYSTIVLEEGGQHTKKTFDLLRLSLRTPTTAIKCRMLVTFNWQGQGFGWLKKMAWDRNFDEGINPSSIYFLRATVHDNPTLFEQNNYMEMLQALPSSLRKRNLDGDPTGEAEGQFFSEFNITLRETPFNIPREKLRGRLFGALDVGTTHATAFNLGYIDDDGVVHILFSYLNSGLTMQSHAQSIFDYIQSFPYTNGIFPDKIFADPASYTQVKLNESVIRSPIQEYIDLFKNHKVHTVFEKANNNRVNGSMMMRDLFAQKKVRYFINFNGSFERAMQNVVADENNMESYLKTDSIDDDQADASRYLIVSCYSISTNILQKDRFKPLTRRDILIRGGNSGGPVDYYSSEIKYI
jgi:PBSX family phage terminase large subunit